MGKKIEKDVKEAVEQVLVETEKVSKVEEKQIEQIEQIDIKQYIDKIDQLEIENTELQTLNTELTDKVSKLQEALDNMQATIDSLNTLVESQKIKVENLESIQATIIEQPKVVDNTIFEYKYDVGEHVMYPRKYQKMKFKVTAHQGISSDLGPLYRISQFERELLFDLIPESELVENDQGEGFKNVPTKTLHSF